MPGAGRPGGKRGDLETWLLQPGERTFHVHRKQPDGTSAETVYRGGTVQPVVLPNVAVDLEELCNL